jgi:anti-sigma B factor antagonist
MEVKKIQEGSKLTIAVKGRIDSVTAPELDKEVNSSLEGVTELVFDFSELEYTSSAGLRVLLEADKTMEQRGSMKVTGVSEDVKQIFAITGFDMILNIE